MTVAPKITFGQSANEQFREEFSATPVNVSQEAITFDAVYDPFAASLSVALPTLQSARTDDSVMFTLSRDVLRMPINEGDSLTYGDVFYANRFVRECGDDPAVFEKLIRSEHETAANLLAWCRNDVSVAIAVCQSVARLRLAIVMSDNS